MNNKEIMELSDKALMPTYARFPLALVKGKGTRVWDGDGRQYLDFLSGIAVCNLGHCHPAVTRAICEQAVKLLHVSNLYHIEPQAELAALLTEITFADKVFFANSGAEANEGAIKLARKYQSDKGLADKYRIVTASMSFHGRTLATLTATGQEKVKVGFAPLPEGFDYVPYNDIDALAAAVGDDTAAVMLEPLQGEGGVHTAAPGYLAKALELCEQHGALLILDEVQTGAGRTGTFLACEAENVTPHIATMAKGLGGGVPIGALLAVDEVADSFGPGTHATTFGGNPLCTAAALAATRTLISEHILENCRSASEYFFDKLESFAASTPAISEVRGKGLLIGVELADNGDAAAVVEKLMEKGFLVGTAGPSVVRFAPPLTVDKSEIAALMVTFEEILEEQG